MFGKAELLIIGLAVLLSPGQGQPAQQPPLNAVTLHVSGFSCPS